LQCFAILSPVLGSETQHLLLIELLILDIAIRAGFVNEIPLCHGLPPAKAGAGVGWG